MAAKTRALATRLVRDEPFRDLVIRCAGTFFNLVLVVFNVVMAQGKSSLWNHAMAGYFCVLTILGSYIAICMQHPKQHSAHRILRTCGFCLCALAIAFGVLMGVCIGEQHSERLNEIMVIALATLTFATTTIAVVDATRIHNGSPMQQAIARVSVASAIGALLVLEIQMLGTFGDPTSQLAFVIEAISGAVAVLLVLLMGFSLLRKS